LEHGAAMIRDEGSGFDIRYPPGHKPAKRMSNPKLH
jgi:hypothetical protein